MPSGFEVYNSSGLLMFDHKWPVMSANSRYPLPSGTIMSDASGVDMYERGCISCVAVDSDGTWGYDFYTPSSLPRDRYGLEVFDDAGNLTFSSAHRPLILVQRVVANESNYHNLVIPIPSGKTYGFAISGVASSGYATNIIDIGNDTWQYTWVSIMIQPVYSATQIKFQVTQSYTTNLYSSTSTIQPVDQYLRFEGFVVDVTGIR